MSTLSQAVKRVREVLSACWLCGGAGTIEVANCSHDTRRKDSEPCTEKCMRNEVCFNCGGRGRE